MKSEPKARILFSRKEVAATVKRLAAEINRDYRGKNPLLIGILKGSFMFMADLVRLLDFPLEVDFIRVSSYGRRRESSGRIKVVSGLSTPVKGRDVLVVEDIVDTGLTSVFLLGYLRKKRPSSLKLCALTDKPSRRRLPLTIDYLGFTVPDKFVVGYGIDWDEKFRYLPDICVIEDEK
jgi:hypoxanthine phosphoribosyltransferase